LQAGSEMIAIFVAIPFDPSCEVTGTIGFQK
jgi:hypothetical protein